MEGSSFLSFGPVSVSPYHDHSWVVEFQYQNRGHRDTILYRSNVFNKLSYIPCLQFLHIVSYRSVSSPPLSSSPSYAAAVRSLAPAKSIPSCIHHFRATQAPGLRIVFSQRSIIGRVVIYCATLFCLFNT